MGANRTFKGLSAIVVVGLIAAGCSSGPSAEVTAFCDDYVEVQGLMTIGPDDTDPMPWVEDLTAGLNGLEADAPAEIATAVEGMAGALLAPVEALDEEAYFAATESEEFVAHVDVINEYIGGECGFASVEVTAVDFAFEAELDDLAEGKTMFQFSNAGSELHEMVLIRINDDTTESVDELLELPEEEAEAKTQFMGVSFAAPGGESTMFAELDAGRYVVLCFVPTGSTSFEDAETADGPPHFTHGMMKEFTVEA